MSLDFSFFDALVVLVVVGSAAYATWKGFVDETLSIVAWAGAAFGSLYFGPWAVELMRSMVSTGWVAMIAGYAVVFTILLIPLSFASHRFAQSVRSSAVGPIDRVLGTTFGVVRGLAILGIAYLVFTAFVPIRSQPHWLTTARTLPLIRGSSEVLLSVLPSHMRKTDQASASPLANAGDTPSPEPTPRPKPGKPVKKGYGVGDRRALDRLFEATGNGGSGKP